MKYYKKKSSLHQKVFVNQTI